MIKCILTTCMLNDKTQKAVHCTTCSLGDPLRTVSGITEHCCAGVNPLLQPFYETWKNLHIILFLGRKSCAWQGKYLTYLFSPSLGHCLPAHGFHIGTGNGSKFLTDGSNLSSGGQNTLHIAYIGNCINIFSIKYSQPQFALQ